MSFCEVNNCFNGGVCILMPPHGNETCICPRGFDGDFCEDGCLLHTAKTLGNGGWALALCLLVLLIILAVLYIRERRTKQCPHAAASTRAAETRQMIEKTT
ncbi:unnamed protein product, partial [Mesorhabditis belari]|uniref:EGF-like domain-containing protein n=1 Tax=Mesorhabditis belari TaxID=2138241 RepID=A0AAF3F0N8_9BILA